jgi:hypothetical protein
MSARWPFATKTNIRQHVNMSAFWSSPEMTGSSQDRRVLIPLVDHEHIDEHANLKYRW